MSRKRSVPILCSNLHTLRYSDPRLQEWIERFDELMRTPGEIERRRAEYLTPEEREEILEEEAWSMEHGL